MLLVLLRPFFTKPTKKKKNCRQLAPRNGWEEKMHTPGVEPGSHAWEACMMPLHYVCLWCDLEKKTVQLITRLCGKKLTNIKKESIL